MKKTFPLTDSRHKPARVVERIKSEIRKYLKRERGKKLPEGADFWDFDCRAGKDVESATKVHVKELNPAIDRLSAEGAEGVYMEILAKPRTRGGS